ncbi:MAG: hypothetical protein L0Y55_00180, partial [Anaerolineales bacterium]|nr:hypothetical protein [Anaerolineales bacterium]
TPRSTYFNAWWEQNRTKKGNPMKRILPVLCILVLTITGCGTLTGDVPCCGPTTPTPSPAVPPREQPQPQVTFVLPTIAQLEPAQAAPGDSVRVTARGGRDIVPGGFIEPARNFPISFDGKPVATIACQAGTCIGTFTVPNDAVPGAHQIAIANGAPTTLQVVAATAKATPSVALPTRAAPVATTAPAPKVIASPQAVGATNTYWVTNPTSGARLYTQVVLPKNASGKLPVLVLVPGGIGWGGNFLDPPNKAQQLADAGFVVVVFDPDGRGKSAGKDDFDGFVQQDGLAAIVRFAATLPSVDASKIGIVTYSYGITMGSGALARYPDLPVKFLIDWEGPADRNYTTSGCNFGAGKIHWQPCTDNAFWSEREAVNFIGKLRVPYQRIQSEKDHVQPNNAHAIDLINAAIKGGVTWTRLNDYPPNQTYDPKSPPQMLSEQQDRQLEQRIAKYAHELFGK